MYITGTASDYTSRLHQLPGTSQPTGATFVSSCLADIASFKTEGRSYIASGLASPQVSGKWEQELRVTRWRLSGDGAQMLTQQL